jgi:hypothetical protein
VANKGKQLGRLLDHLIDDVGQPEDRKQDRRDARDPNDPRHPDELPPRPSCFLPPAMKAREEALGFS